MNFRTSVASLILASGALLVAPDLLAANSYRVAANIQQGGKTVGEPVVVVRPGAPASVEKNGADGYTMTITVIPQEDNLLQVTVKAETFHGSVSTGITTRAGKPIVVASGDLDLTLTIAEDGA